MIAEGGLDGVDEIYAVHCDPKVDAGQIGTRIGPITSASDEVSVTITSPGGHTSRPHLTGDVVYALGQVITQVPPCWGAGSIPARREPHVGRGARRLRAQRDPQHRDGPGRCAAWTCGPGSSPDRCCTTRWSRSWPRTRSR
ncbi:hypothetical protein NKG05_23675 [Oerskovia sp. M15]